MNSDSQRILFAHLHKKDGIGRTNQKHGCSLVLVLVFLIGWLLQLNDPLQAQETVRQMMQLNEKQKKALAILEQTDTLTASPIWPNVKPGHFFNNLRKNILYPLKINQGAATNFCGYAAMTHLMITYDPELYTKNMLSLYQIGRTDILHKTLAPSAPIREAAGSLVRKGELDILHADQLWFLTLADQFKGYMNIVDQKYNPGDENMIWAGTNYAKFNKMIRSFTDFKLKTKGSDFVRPITNSFYDYITQQMSTGVVFLFVNSKFLYPHKFTLFKLRAPTHFIVLYDMEKTDDMIRIRYWDYGMKTEQLITRKRLKKLIFGVTTITSPAHDTL
jgi:hypothetical protein